MMRNRMIISVVLALTAALPAHAGKRADLNGDGQVSREERAAAKQNRFRALDMDKNGTVSQEELTRNKKDPQKMAERMAKLDANHDGQISSDEFSARKNARIARRSAKKPIANEQ